MNEPLPGRLPAHTAGQQLPTTITTQIGITESGGPIWATYSTGPATTPQQPIAAKPWGAYLGGGCLALIAVVVIAVILVALLFGLAIFAAVLALVAVALTICVLVLRDMWNTSRKT